MANDSLPICAAVPADARRGIQSLEVGLSILHVLAQAPGPLTLKEVASAANLPGSNCHRYLVSFARAGYVTQNESSGRYDLGPAVLQVGLSALGRLDEVGIAVQELERLVDATGNTGMVVIWADAGPTIVRWMQGREPVRTTLAAGSTLPLLTTATGQMFLAFLPCRQTAGLAAKEGARMELLADLTRKGRAAGWGQVSGNHIPGLNAAAAPVLNAWGEAVAVLTLVRAGRPLTPTSVAALRGHADAASQALGWTGAALTAEP